MSEADRDPSVFERTAEGYAAVRPRYTDAAIDHVVETTGLTPGATLLELGCGPGFATEPFARRGFRVEALDAARAMIAQARARCAGLDVTFEHVDFRAWTPPADRYDLVLSAMAFHWMPKAGRDAKLARAAKPGAPLVILANWPTDVWEAGQDLYAAHWPDHEPAAVRTFEERVERQRADLAVQGVFTLHTTWRRPWVATYDAATYVHVLDTYSDHVALSDDVRAAFYAAVRTRIDELGGTIERAYDEVVLVARPA